MILSHFGNKKTLRSKTWYIDFSHHCTGSENLVEKFLYGARTMIKLSGLMSEEGMKRTNQYFKRVKRAANLLDFYFHSSNLYLNVLPKSDMIAANKIKIIGQPKHDKIADYENSKANIKKLLGNSILKKKIILYAPTFRGNLVPTKWFPFEDFQPQKLEEFLEFHSAIMLIRPHEFEVNSIFFNLKGVIKFGSDICPDITEILASVDVLVTDYSGIYIEHLITQKPQIFIPYDIEDYKSQRGFLFEYDEITPGPKPSTMKEFLKCLKNAFVSPNYDLEKRKYVKDAFHTAPTDRNCERILNFSEH